MGGEALALAAILISLLGIGFGVAKVYERLGGVVEGVRNLRARVEKLEEKIV